MTEQKRTWSLHKLGNVAKNSLDAVFHGELLLRLDVGRFFVHILYTFFLITVAIWISFRIDQTLLKVEENKDTLRELEIIHSQKIFDIAQMSRRGAVAERLGRLGSKVKEAEKPAMTVKR